MPLHNQPGAAVAVIRIRKRDPEFLLLKRADNPLDPWSGHFALPGGRRELGDADLFSTCLRETREECGVSLTSVHLVRELPWCRAGRAGGREALVAPFLFELENRPSVLLSRAEIAEFHWIERSYLLDKQNHARRALSRHWPHLQFPCVPVGKGFLWGFTYQVLTALLDSDGEGPAGGGINHPRAKRVDL